MTWTMLGSPALGDDIMHGAELLLLALMVAVAGLSVLARLVDVPYPILLVLGGLVLGFVPGLPAIELPPDVVLVLFLPPLLYVAAFFSSPRELLVDLRAISLLALGLVPATMGAVAVTAHTLIAGLPWAPAFALGAIVSPTDPLAATTIARRLGVSRRVVTLLEGESLVNDATGLILYRVAVGVAVGGSFALGEAGLEFVISVAGGIAVGLIVGWIVAEVRRRLEDPPIEILLTVVTGYAAYVPADEMGLSGVLAAVTAGLYLGWKAPEIASAETRLLGFSFWEVVAYLLNAALFVLLGLQLHPILGGVSGWPTVELVGLGLVVSAVVIVVRIGWEFTIPYLIRAIDRSPSQLARRIGPGERLVIGWSGMRGAVSLAAALALPLEVGPGQQFPERDLLVFLTFGVIFSTLVLQGLTLPALIRRLRVKEDGTEEDQELRGRIGATDAALTRLDELASEEWTRDETIERLRALYQFRRRRLSVRAGADEDDTYEERSLAYQRLVRELLDAQRHAIVRLRNDGTISNDVMHRIERDLDLEDSRLEI